MKKFLLLLVALMVTLSLTACGGVPEDVTMDNVDDYLGRDDVQYVDLRNFDDKMAVGYIAGFEFIPYFDYMEFSGIMTRDGDWEFEAASLLSQSALEGLFDKDKTIFLMCGSGTRAGYVLDALESIGYENVINVGGIADYAGENKVLGDGEYTTQPQVGGDYTPGTYYGFGTGGYFAVVVINANGGIETVAFDALTCSDSDDDGIKETCTTKQDLGADYGMQTIRGTDYAWFEQANMTGAAVVAAQGWDWTLEAHEGSTHMYFGTDGVAGVSIGAEGFEAAFNDAIAQAVAE